MERPIQSGSRHASRDREGAVPTRRMFARSQADSRQRRRGFTFVEMMVVVTIIVILISMAIPIYNRAITRSKESVLHNNLFTIRTVLDNYCYDKAKCPQSLSDLVSEGYLRAVPIDPMTNAADWKVEMEDASQSISQSEPGIWEVHSNSDKTGLDGRPYAEW